MASSLRIVCADSPLLVRGWGSLSRRLQSSDSPLSRNIITDASAQVQISNKDETEGKKTLSAVLHERRDQAQRSVLISYQTTSSHIELQKHLARHGDIKNIFFYECYGGHCVVEFASHDSVATLQEEASIPNLRQESVVPFKSRLLSLRSLSATGAKRQSSASFLHAQKPITSIDLIHRLSRENTVDCQVVSLTEALQLTDENVRLRFLVCSLLNDVAAGLFPESVIWPFGSSVNGFGKLGCDLDMYLDLEGISGRTGKAPKSGLSLEYKMKLAKSERAVTQSILSVIGLCVNEFGPGCVGMQKILNARCPLVRFTHQPSGFQCDLTVSNRVAMKSTELLYLYGQLDPRVRYLVFTVRSWARVHNITSSIPGAWITNFSLTVMVLFFLQQRSPPIIPTLDHLRLLAGPADTCIIEGNDCTFVSDHGKVQLQDNTETPMQLLSEFFEFYATFPFNTMSISIRKGKQQTKPETVPLYIQNPFETHLNVSKNVSSSQLQRFVALCKESSWLLEQKEAHSPHKGTHRDMPPPWGLATLLLPSQAAMMQSRKRKTEPASQRIKHLLESLKKDNLPKKSTT